VRTRTFSQDDLTVGEWLAAWLQEKEKSRAAKTILGYKSHINLYLAPHLGAIRLDRLALAHVYEMFDAIEERNEQILAANEARRQMLGRLKTTSGRAARRQIRDQLAAMEPFRRPVGAASKQSIRATLRSALSSAIRRGKITVNVARNVELPSGKPPRPLLWTPGRVEAWRRTGVRPGPVMVWTPEQTGKFLDATYHDRLYALFHLAAFRGPRRGELCAVHWPDVDLDRKKILIQWQLVVVGWQVLLTPPKTDAGVRELVLDEATVEELRRHRRRQEAERRAMGLAWDDAGPVFTTLDGALLHPAAVTTRFQELASAAELPPIRFHDLRHVAATLMLGAKADIKVVQETLGHSSYEVTANAYTSVLDELARAAAEGAARLVPRTPPTTPAHTSRTREIDMTS
jgi:integrase